MTVAEYKKIEDEKLGKKSKDDLTGAGVSAGAQLIAGLLGQAAQSQARATAQQSAAERAAAEAQVQGQRQLGASAQGNLRSLMDSYRSSFLKR